MKKLLALLAVPVLILALVTPVLAQASLPFNTDLIPDGRDTALDVGDFSITADGTFTFEINESESEWRIEETHLYVGDEPPAKSMPGKFPYKHEGLGGVVADGYAVDLIAADINRDGIIYVAAHASLLMQTGIDAETGEPVYACETTWAQGDEPIGKGANWATYFAISLPIGG